MNIAQIKPACYVHTSPDGRLQCSSMSGEIPADDQARKRGWTVRPAFYVENTMPSPDEKLVIELVSAMKKIRNASDDLNAYYGGVDGRTELDKAIAEADAVLAAVGAKEA